MGMEVGLIGLIGLALIIYAVVKTLGSNAGTGAKVLWILALLVFPIVGFIAWLIFGPR